jgi:hypothetical protein
VKTLLSLTAAALLVSTAAHAGEVYNYACHRPDDFKLYAAKLDLTNKTITWNGSVYRNLKSLTYDCAKACFQATNRNGMVVLSTATQGVASLTVSGGGPGSDGEEELECDVVRK